MRKISKTLALMSLLAPLGANALGIGDIKLHSALNQSLNAEIPLVTSGSDELAELRVTLASPEAFSRAGIERHYSLSKLRFTPQQKADGSYIIKVSSSESIREPFLNFMIEVYWPQGRIQREFTVLLDPPASFQENDSTEAELPETEAVARPARRPTYMEPIPVAERPRRTARVVEMPPQAVEPVSVTGTQYGPIGRNETLWGIAKQFSPEAAVSQDKMMKALYRANPQAFSRSNINALKAGETITIPDKESIARLTGAASIPPMSRNTGRLSTKTERADEAEANPQGQLKLLAPADTEKSRDETASSGGRGREGRSKDDMALEVAAVRQENEEIRKTLLQMKEQMQRLLNSKDEQIAALQSQQKPQPATGIAQPPAAPAQIPPSVEPARTAPAAEAPKELPRTTPATVPPTPVPTPAQEARTTAPPTSKPAETTRPAPPPSRPVVKQTPVQAKPVQKTPAPAKDEGILAELLDHPTYTVVGGIVVLLASAMWFVKRRRAAMIDDTESILTLSEREKMLNVNKRSPIAIDQTSGISEQTSSTAARSSFLSEFTPSDFDALGGEMEEVDPISEADVYLAYGRYKQAEELIHSAIAQNPERDECKLKLLEIHYATENAEAFEAFAEELAPTHKDAKPEFWEKVSEMGQELCPDSPLFNADVNIQASHSNRQEVTSPSGKEEEYLFEQEEDEESLGYSVSPAASTHRPQTEAREPQTSTIAYDFFATEPTAPEISKEAEEDSELPQFDNVIAFDRNQSGSSTATDDIEEAQEKTLDDILAELGVLSESASLKKPSSPKPREENEEEDAGLEFEFRSDKPVAGSGDLQFDDEHSAVGNYGDLNDMDEQETKLDLAKAYFDMGDVDAAKAILEDVAEYGSGAQKEEAWSLLNKLTRKEVNKR